MVLDSGCGALAHGACNGGVQQKASGGTVFCGDLSRQTHRWPVAWQAWGLSLGLPSRQQAFHQAIYLFAEGFYVRT